MSKNKVKNVARKVYNKHVTDYRTSKYKRVIDNFGNRCISKLLLPNVKIESESKVLELACGEGHFTRDLLAEFPEGEFLATDYSDEMVDYVRSTLGDKGNVKSERLNALELDNKYSKSDFTFVVFRNSEVYFTTKEKQLLFMKIYKVLKPGGFFFYQPVDFASDQIQTIKSPKSIVEKIHVHYMANYFLSVLKARHASRESMLQEIKKIGFTFSGEENKEYAHQINNYGELKGEMGMGIEARLEISGYNVLLFKFLARFIAKYPIVHNLNQSGFLFQK